MLDGDGCSSTCQLQDMPPPSISPSPPPPPPTNGREVDYCYAGGLASCPPCLGELPGRATQPLVAAVRVCAAPGICLHACYTCVFHASLTSNFMRLPPAPLPPCSMPAGKCSTVDNFGTDGIICKVPQYLKGSYPDSDVSVQQSGTLEEKTA